MTSITRWVLAHKRIVVASWVVLTLVGAASAGSATKALKQKFSVPGKEGFITNQQIQRDFRGTGGNAAPLLAVVTLPASRPVDSAAVQAELRGVESRLQSALPQQQRLLDHDLFSKATWRCSLSLTSVLQVTTGNPGLSGHVSKPIRTRKACHKP